MNPKFERFKRAARDYPEFRAQFSKFCEASAKILNGNSHLPGVSFSPDDGGTKAIIGFAGQTFVVRFHLVPANERPLVGVLGAYIPAPTGGEETLLWHTFFGINGNVMDTPDAAHSIHSVWDSQFLEKLLGEFSDRYFSRMIEKFKLGALPPR